MRSWDWIMSCYLIAVVPYAATAADHNDNESWSLSAGGQLDNKHGSILDASLGFDPNKANSFLLDANRSTSAEEISGLSTNAATFSYLLLGTKSGLSVGVHWFRTLDVVDAKEATVGVQSMGAHWHVQINGAYRKSDFDSFHPNTVVRRRDGTLVTVAATATCNLNNTSYRAESGYDGDALRVYVKGTKYNYDDTDCTFDSPLLNALLKRTNVAEFRQLAATLTQRLSRLAVTQLRQTNENSFLSSAIDAGFKFTAGPALLAFDYQHARDEFDDLKSNTYTASVDFDILKSSDISIQGGAVDAESIGTTAFLGLTFTTRF